MEMVDHLYLYSTFKCNLDSTSDLVELSKLLLHHFQHYHASLFKIKGNPSKPIKEKCHHSTIWVLLHRWTNKLPKLWATVLLLDILLFYFVQCDKATDGIISENVFHLRKETRHAVRLINMQTISLVWMLGEKIGYKAKRRRSELVYCLPTYVWGTVSWLTLICPVHSRSPGVMRCAADSRADSFTGAL